MGVDIQAVPILKDNYAWLIHTEKGGAIVVDPGEAEPIADALQGHRLDAILLTHYHNDHTAGAEELRKRYGAVVYAPENVRLAQDHTVTGGESLTISGVRIHVLATPGHANEHVSYVLPDVPALFSGDVLFSGGCGRLIDGTPEELFASFRLYDSLPNETRVYAGHEYTEANLSFVIAQAPTPTVSEALKRRYDEVLFLRKNGKPTLPVSLKVERETNPFLRASTVEELARWRRLKDKA